MIDILFAIDISETKYRTEWSGQGQTLKLLKVGLKYELCYII